jgi:hypothetical protein
MFSVLESSARKETAMNTNQDAQELAKQELTARLSLIETMIAEGRQKTESWGWTFVLWGVAYGAAIVIGNWGAPLAEWSTWGHRSYAWPITMIGGVILTLLIALGGGRKGESHPETTIGRAISSMWIAMGISMFLLLLAAGMSGRYDPQMYVAIVAAMLGTTNAASSMILKWRAQFFCAVVWWATAVASCFSSIPQSLIVFLVAIFFCQIVFGAYGMISESRQRKSRERASGAVHA